MKPKPFVLLLITATIVVGMFTWFSSNHEHNNDFTLPGILTMLLALVFSIATRLEILKIIFATTGGVLLSLIIKIIIDGYYDPTSHNLWPFEIIIVGFLILVACVVGVLPGVLFRLLKKRKHN
jgi:hypothetical protein